jgi:hypothetical protein
VTAKKKADFEARAIPHVDGVREDCRPLVSSFPSGFIRGGVVDDDDIGRRKQMPHVPDDRTDSSSFIMCWHGDQQTLSAIRSTHVAILFIPETSVSARHPSARKSTAGIVFYTPRENV